MRAYFNVKKLDSGIEREFICWARKQKEYREGVDEKTNEALIGCLGILKEWTIVGLLRGYTNVWGRCQVVLDRI